jgi:hypothetical protein
MIDLSLGFSANAMSGTHVDGSETKTWSAIKK